MRTRYRLLSLMMVLSFLLSTVSPVLAQDSWPSGRDQGDPASQAPAPSTPRVTGPAPLPAGTVIGPQFDEESQISSARTSNLRRVETPETTNLAGQHIRERLVSPRGRSLPSAISADPAIAAMSRQGPTLVRTVIHLDKPSLALAGETMTPEQRVAYAAEVAALQNQVAAEVEARGGQVLVRFQNLSSGFAALVPGNQVAAVARHPRVARVSSVVDYEIDLSETVPHIGGKLLQDLGLMGKGVNVAVLDTGIDYTHLAFGGPGTYAAYDEAYLGTCTYADPGLPSCANAQVANPALFGPNAPKVKGGYDWLGEDWPDFGPMAPDPNPIDIGGHGTNVADIIAGFAYNAGTNEDGPYLAKGSGMAPGANLWAYKVCASFSTACNGVALLAAIDDAVDLDNNPATKDPADIINLSLGSPYGQPEDDLTFFVNQAVAYGSIVVASAGNSADKPYITGSPSAADGAISVAQTTVPSEKQYLPTIDSPVAISGTLKSAVWQNWSVHPDDSGPVSGTVAYGNADGTNKNGCAAFTDDMTGKVVLMDRGVCNFTQKAMNASAAGAVLGFIGLVAPGDPFTGGDGGHRPINMPVFMISQAESNRIKSGLAQGVVISLSPDVFIGLVDSMVGSSSRGPRNNDGAIKPDIGAPGASISAVAGSGAETTAFGGTSGAAPMVSGAAALLKGFFKNQLTPQQYKALLMNTGNTTIYLDGAVANGGGGTLAPVTRIGGGQVDVAKAYQTRLIAWDSTDKANPLSWTGSMSFGYIPVSDTYVATRTLSIKNLGSLGQSVQIGSFFRYADDFQKGLYVTPLLTNPFIPAGSTVEVPVLLEIYNNGLKEWSLNKGSLGANGVALSVQEYDGYIQIVAQNGATISVPWQILPKKAADVRLGMGMARAMPGSSALINYSTVYTGVSEAFSLVDINPNDYNYAVGNCANLGLAPGCNETAIDLKEVGVRDWNWPGVDQILEFGLTVWDHPYRASQHPVGFDIYIDADRDGEDDYVIFNYDAALSIGAADGRNLVFIQNLATNALSAFFYTDSDFNTQNWILSVPASAVGLSPGQQFDFAVYTFDGYFTFDYWDCSPCFGSHTYTLGQPRFDLGEDQLTIDTPPADFVEFIWESTPAHDVASPSQIGLLFLHRYAPIGSESDHLLLAAPFVEAEGLELVAEPAVAPIGQPITLTATVTNTDGMTDQHTVWFSDGSFTAQLSGINEVPPVTTTATGLATFVVNFATGVTTYTLDVTGLISPTAAHIHVGPAGVNGGVIHWLYHSTGVNAPATLPATGVITLTHGQIELMLQEGLYVNVHTPANPGGEIRGQIKGAVTAYTDASGQASTVITSPVPLQKTMYALTGDLMDSVQVAFVQATGLSVTAEPAQIMFGESVTVTAVVTGAHGGPLVGETVFATDGILTAQLSGANEVPANESTATGVARFVANPSTYDPVSQTLRVDYTLIVEGLENITGAHVHRGAAGVNGPVAYPLQVGAGSFNMAAADLVPLLTGQFYVNVHTQAIPAGEIRGQILGAAMGVTDANGVATFSFTPNYAGMVTIYAAPLTNPLLLRMAMVIVNQEYTISVSANPEEGGTVSGGGTVNHGDTVTVTATANDGYVFVNWTEGETVVSTDASYEFTAMGDRTLVANFAQIYEIYLPLIFR